ncbi:MAG: FAD-dependent monooxygenase [Cystobacter sp.]
MLDALVVGAGPTGLTMASELARYGLSCRLVEQLEAPSPLSRALAVQARTLEIFEHLGIAERAVARGRRPEAINVVGQGGVRTRVPLGRFDWLETRYPYPLLLPQDATEALLTGLLESWGGRLEWGVALEDFQQDGEGVLATLKHAEGRSEQVRARWLIGCDGARSRTRKLLGLPFEGTTYEDACMLADVRVDWSLGAGEMCIMPSAHGMTIAMPLPGDHRYRIFAIMPRDEASDRAADTAPVSLEEFQTVMDRMVPVPIRVSEPTWMSRYRLHSRGVSRYRQGRAFLAGDAAHIHSPIGGQGMNTGIQDAFNLAWKLALVTRGRASDALLDTYEAERHRVGRHLLEGTDRAFTLIASGGLPARLFRAYVFPRIARRMSGVGRVQRRVLRFGSQLAIHYRKSPLSTERLWGEDTNGVRMTEGPAAGDRVPELPVKGVGVERLHQVLHAPRHTLLLLTGLSPEPRATEALVALARRLEAAYATVLQVRVVVAGAEAPSAQVLADTDGAVHRRFGAGSECFYLVRPDGYVAHRERPMDARRLEMELERRLGSSGR